MCEKHLKVMIYDVKATGCPRRTTPGYHDKGKAEHAQPRTGGIGGQPIRSATRLWYRAPQP
jgi:hypothetical protein